MASQPLERLLALLASGAVRDCRTLDGLRARIRLHADGDVRVRGAQWRRGYVALLCGVSGGLLGGEHGGGRRRRVCVGR